jgi:hypothetical protein
MNDWNILSQLRLFLRCVVVQVESPDNYCSKSQMTLLHWPGRRNRIKRTTTLLPSRGHFRKQTCDAVCRYGLTHTSCGHNSKWAFFELRHYAICWRT